MAKKKKSFKFIASDFSVSSLTPDQPNAESAPKIKDTREFRVYQNNDTPEAESGRPIRFDPETQRKIEAMAREAKEKGTSSSNGLSEDYLKMINSKQHNSITMSAAGDKVKEFNKKMNEEIIKTSPDEATTDILAETANDNIVYRNYDLSDLDEYINNIGQMTLFESISLKNSVAKELNRLESCHSMIKAVNDLRDNFDYVEPGKEPSAMDRRNAGTNVDRSVMKANYLDEYGFKESEAEFNDIYTQYQPKLQNLIDKLNAHIKELSPQASSTRYMTNDFLHIINKHINNLATNNVNYNREHNKLLNLRDCFEKRTSLDWLVNKLDIFVKNTNHLKDINRAFSGTMSDIAPKLNAKFATKTMHNFVFFINSLWEGNYTMSLSFMYFLNYICAHEADSNLDAWVKVLLLNVSDMTNDIWDIDEVDEDTYAIDVRNRFAPALHKIEDYIKTRNTKVNPVLIKQYEELVNMKLEDASAEEIPEEAPVVEPEVIE